MSIALTVDVFACPCDAEISRAAEALAENSHWVPTPGLGAQLLRDVFLQSEYRLFAVRGPGIHARCDFRFHVISVERGLVALQWLRLNPSSDISECPVALSNCGDHIQLSPVSWPSTSISGRISASGRRSRSRSRPRYALEL